MYIKDLNIALNRLMSFLNLDLNSLVSGSFDKYYWAWKKRDFQDSTLAYAIQPLIKASKIMKSSFNISNVNYSQEIVIKNMINIQLSDASFDQSYPNEKHPKIGLDISSVLYEYLQTHKNPKISQVYKKLIDYSLKSEEKYGIICNHLAHHTYEYLLAYDYFKEEIYYQKAIGNLHIIKKNTHEEGWHTEYLGGDAGYQTRALRYLTKCLGLLKDKNKKLCESLCIKSMEFLDKLISPDGTVYAMFGSRNTALVYPSGIEYMASHYPERFSSLAFRVRESVKNKVAILPLQLEFDNFVRLFDDFLDAQIYYEKNKDLKIQNLKISEFDLKNFGLKKIDMNGYSVYFHYKYGGPIVIYKNNKLFYKDAGFLIEHPNGEFFGTRNLLSYSRLLIKESFIMQIQTEIFKSVHQELTPLKLIVIRLLNLTILRFSWFANVFRSIVVKTIIIGEKKESYGTVTRTLSLENNSITIEDGFNLKFKPKSVYRTLFLNLFHMASSRYFHPVDREMEFYKEEKIQFKKEFTITKKIKSGD